jgi:small-conductance mechanosensitive channel
VSSPEPSFKTRFGFKPDFPFERLLGFVFSIVMIIFLRPYITDFVPSPYYSITIDGDDFIIFTELSMWTLILMTFVIFLTVFFIIPLTLYFRGLSEWEWDPTVVVFWMIMTRGSSLFFSEIADTNAHLKDYTLILVDIVDSIFVLFMTVFLLRAYSNYFVPVISDWLTVGKTDTQYGPLLEIIGSLLIIIFGITNFLSTYHVDFGVLLAGVGVVGLVFALAAQDTLSNFFSGILLLLDQGFKTGDMIYFNDTYCLIREIGLRSTKIYDIVNHVMIITPNNSLANQNILNLTRPDRYYRIRIEVGVSYDSDPDQVEKLLLEVAEQNSDVEQNDPTRMPLVRFQDFGDSSLTFVLVAWINNVIKIRQINSDLHHQVFDKLKDAGVTIAFPQRDVHIHGVSEPAISKSPRPASTKSTKPATAKSPNTAVKKSPKRAAKKKK